jgi:PAS domain S-box-containing protein
MKYPEIPKNENDRLAELNSYNILDTLPEAEYDDITQLAASICDTSIALISFVDGDRQWFKSRLGIDATATSRDVSFCAHAVAENKILYVPNATQDPRFSDNPLVVGEPKIRFYCGIPLVTPNHHVLGTLCVIDLQPKVLVPHQIEQLERLSRLVMSQLELRRNQNTSRLLASVVEFSNDAIITQTLDGMISSWNSAAEKLFGYTSDEIIGKSILILVPPDLLEEERLMIDRLKRGEVIERFETIRLCKDGNHRNVSLTISPLIDGKNKMIGTSSIVRDITEHKITEAKLIQVARLKDEFLANMSHELRTPLNAILGMTEGLQEKFFGTINKPQVKALQTIERSALHLLSLINNILDVAKIESGQIELEQASVAITHLCSSSLVFVKQPALKKRIRLETKLTPDLIDVFVDERRMRQVLINLLTNAVKFTPEGGTVTLSVSLLPDADVPRVDDGTRQHYFRIAVRDTGIGIAPENINKLFQPFVQIDSALNRKYAGTGLGLALVKQIVELHGGRVEVMSELGIGSCFTIDLPCGAEAILPCNSSMFPIAGQGDLPATVSGVPLTTPLILLAEDHEANISTVSNYLTAKGYRVISAKNGKEAIAMAYTQSPDLILMDIQMSEMDGLEAMEQIRQDSQLRNIPIIALTALAMAGDRERCLDAGADHSLSKPVRLKELATTIQQLL